MERLDGPRETGIGQGKAITGNGAVVPMKTLDILFFGAGRLGRYWLECCKDFGIIPKGMVDNDRGLCGCLCEGIPVYHPDSLGELSFEAVFITCGRAEEIRGQLLGAGVPENRIVAGSRRIFERLLHYGASGLEVCGRLPAGRRDKAVLLDLQNGMVLGGVEAWTYSLARELKEKGYRGLYLTMGAAEAGRADQTFPAEVLRYGDLHKEKDKVQLCVNKILENAPCTVICNFPQIIFWSACVAKMRFPDQIRIIAVQHNDERIYYETYALWREYIDKCMVISSRIEETLKAFGMEKGRIARLEWKVACEAGLDRTWSADGTRLRIGYAGRITKTQKRMDLLPALAVKLRDRGIRFHISVAGAGDYSGTLEERIKKEGLREYITLEGYIERREIPSFWKRQDIMISCSDWEGHSISQSEAMAAGAVPVLTDVSGASDDVTDGYNGYIVGTGDLDGLAERICRLFRDRGMLERMGRSAHETIYHRQVYTDQTAEWGSLLEEVWRK